MAPKFQAVKKNSGNLVRSIFPVAFFGNFLTNLTPPRINLKLSTPASTRQFLTSSSLRVNPSFRMTRADTSSCCGRSWFGSSNARLLLITVLTRLWSWQYCNAQCSSQIFYSIYRAHEALKLSRTLGIEPMPFEGITQRGSNGFEFGRPTFESIPSGLMI